MIKESGNLSYSSFPLTEDFLFIVTYYLGNFTKEKYYKTNICFHINTF